MPVVSKVLGSVYRVNQSQMVAKLVFGVLLASLALVMPLGSDASSKAFDDNGPARTLARHAIGLADTGFFAKAEQEFDKAGALAPRDEEILISKAYTLYGKRRDCVKENQLYGKALEINPSNIRALALRGISFERMNDYRSALTDFDRAIRLSPDDSRLYSCRGLNFRLQHRYKKAISDYDKAISLSPKNAFLLNDRAYTSVWLGLNVQGLRDIDKAISINSKVAEFHETRGILLGEMNRFDESIAAYDLAERLGLTRVILDRAELKMEAHYYRAALPDFQRCVAMYPETGSFYRAKCGQCYIKMQH